MTDFDAEARKVCGTCGRSRPYDRRYSLLDVYRWMEFGEATCAECELPLMEGSRD